MRRGAGGSFALIVVLVLTAGTGHAEWVRGEVRLNLRTAPGSNRKIITTIATGDRVTVLERADDWTRVQVPDGREGWIPAGFLSNEAPAVIQLDRSESELSEARKSLTETTAEAKTLRATNDKLTESNKTLTDANLRLDSENRRLKAGARWPEWITGAAILVVGMLFGAALQARAGRRAHARIRI